MTVKLKDLRERGDEIIGREVIVKQCESSEHGNNDGCVCGLLGKKVIVEKKNRQLFVGQPTYKILGKRKSVRRSEVTLLRRRA